MGTQNGHNVPFLESASLEKRKRSVLKRIKQFYKISKKSNKKKSYHLVPKVVIDLHFEGRKVEGSWKYSRRERVPKARSRGEETITEPINSRIGEFHTNSCGQMLADVWNVAKPLEVEYRRPIHQSSDQSNSVRKEKVKPPCGEETEGQVMQTNLMCRTNKKFVVLTMKINGIGICSLRGSRRLTPFRATRRYKCNPNKVRVKSLGWNSSHLAGFSIFFHDSMKKFNKLAKKKRLLKISLSSITTKVAIKFL